MRCCEVRDTGEGIDPAFLPHVFERFRQETSDVTREHSGLGLGLSLVRHLAELHGGTATAESAGKAQGATFIIRLPLIGVQAGRQFAAENSGVPHPPEARLTSCRISTCSPWTTIRTRASS